MEINNRKIKGKSEMESILSPWKLNQYLSGNQKNSPRTPKKEAINIETEIGLFTER